MKRVLAVLALALALAACSPSATSSQLCGSSAAALSRPILVLEHGDDTAALARVSGGCLFETGADPALGSDQNLLDAHGAAYVGVNDDGSLRLVDPASLTFEGKPIAVYPDHPTPPPPANPPPHGIYGADVDAQGNVWVSRDDVNEVAVFSPGGALITTVDLGSLDTDSPPHPDMNGIYVTGGYAYVALGFLTHDPMNGWIASDVARRPGMIAVIDTATQKLVRHFDLVGHNPVHALVPIDATGTKVVVATPGSYDSLDPDDGIDLVDLEAGTATQLASETRLGGSVDQVAWAGPHEVYALTLGAVPTVNPTKVVLFDPATSDAPKPVVWAPYFDDQTSGAAYVHTSLALDGDLVVVADRTPASAAIRLFPRSGAAELPPIVPRVQAPKQLLPYGP